MINPEVLSRELKDLRRILRNRKSLNSHVPFIPSTKFGWVNPNDYPENYFGIKKEK